MKIQSIQSNTHNKRTSFKKGLTSYEINQVKNMKPFEYADIARNLKNRFGLEANFDGCNTVAWCTNELVKVMTKAGFKLPEKFSFVHLGKHKQLGQFNPNTKEVAINSDYVEFTNLEKQNKLEESQGTFHPKTKHFLQTYLHEFSHAAHFQNLCNKFGFSKAYEIMMGYLNNHTPKEILVEPIRNILGTWLADSIIPPSNGEYAAESLNEYFAEKNSRKLAEQLGPNYYTSNIEDGFAYSYIGHHTIDDYKKAAKNSAMMLAAYDIINDSSLMPIYNFLNPVGSTIDQIDWFKKQICLVDGDIFHGNIEHLKESYFTK